MDLKCKYYPECNTEPVWFYMPGSEDECYCDLHVPRGCSCNVFPPTVNGVPDFEAPEDLWTEELDSFGRRQPCCEFGYF